jgi:hypothetical protein
MLHVLLCGLLLRSQAGASPPVDSVDSIPAAASSKAAGTDTVLDTVPQRPHAVVLSDWYYRRLTIHRWGSYLEFPMFAAQGILGDRLLKGPDTPGLRDEHIAVASALGALFAVNTVTGVWNLAEAWPPPGTHRALLLAHSALMLSADAGFAATAVLGERTVNNFSDRNMHEGVALTSIGLATLGTAMMWLWNR